MRRSPTIKCRHVLAIPIVLPLRIFVAGEAAHLNIEQQASGFLEALPVSRHPSPSSSPDLGLHLRDCRWVFTISGSTFCGQTLDIQVFGRINVSRWASLDSSGCCGSRVVKVSSCTVAKGHIYACILEKYFDGVVVIPIFPIIVPINEHYPRWGTWG